uniref:Uncharacterized protein n=2 Tax=Avena sativa TaxID=4498 RepID=A0ACD5WTS6_AVESA
MAGAGQVLHLWEEWGIQVLVLLSFSLQIMLLIMAELRRRIDSGVLMAFVWSAYMLADATAIYVLGHMSVMSSRSRGHDLVAFWAPFLLLHLGGQDNITAYSIEDNKLWLRHLQTLAVQVAAATYVVYVSSILASGLLRAATILMFVVGVAKYGERVWALKCAGSTTSGGSEQGGGNYEPLFYASGSRYRTIPSKSCPDKEDYLLDAHLFLAVPKKFLMSMLQDEELRFHDIDEHALVEVVEMQLSLMHDVFFTKTEVVHSWCGLCIRAISLPGTAVALLLFSLHHHHYHHHHHMAKGSYSKADIAISYVLLIGALVLEVMSTIKAMFSSWTSSFLLKPRKDFTRPGEEERNIRVLLGRGITSVRRFVHAAEWRGRYWYGSMGQHNMLQLCVGSRVSRISRIARWMGFEDPWNTLAYCSSVPVSALIKQLLVKQVLSCSVLPNNEDHISNSRGLAALKSKGLHEELEWSLDPKRSLEQTILTWHIGTNIYLFFWYKQNKLEQANAGDLIEAVEALSNYMLFLLASRPYMLPAPFDRGMYANSCYELIGIVCSSAEDLANLMLRHYREEEEEETARTNLPFDSILEYKPKTLSAIPFDTSLGNAEDRQKAYRMDLTLQRGCRLAAELIRNGMPDMPCSAIMPELIAQVWIEILCYAGHRCSAYSHAKQLGSGGELITIATLLVEYVSAQALPMLPPLPF